MGVIEEKLEEKFDEKMDWAIKKFDEKCKRMDESKSRFKIDGFTVRMSFKPFGEFTVNFTERK